ncbi:MAG: DUF1934 family protein [Clostridia bacterium]|nr:DUF1934 family protein [Clostridia bacterium]
MKRCTIRIETTVDGHTSLFSGVGSFEWAENGATICYLIDGDEALIRMEKERLTMERQGATALFATFSEGERTEMVLALGLQRGIIPLRTNRYHVDCKERASFVNLNYDLLSEKASTNFQLKISIIFSRES